MKAIKLSALTLAAALSAVSIAEESSLQISDSWARATAPTAKMGGAYMIVSNPTDQADRLMSVTSSVGATQEVHRTVHDNGKMQMVEATDGIEIAANGVTEFKPMGNHIMFIGLETPIVAGEQITATLTFEQQGEVEVTFDVLTPEETMERGAKMMDHGNMNHGGMNHGEMAATSTATMSHDMMSHEAVSASVTTTMDHGAMAHDTMSSTMSQ